MSSSGTGRIRQIVTIGTGVLLMMVVSGVLFAGYRFATQVTAKLAALQTASVLQTYPASITQHLTSLRDRLEARAYTGQAVANLQTTADRFDQQLARLATLDPAHAADIANAQALWDQHRPLITPIAAFTAQPYMDSDEAGGSLSAAGRKHYAEVKQAQLFARQNVERMSDLLSGVTADLQGEATDDASRLRVLLWVGLLAAIALFAAATWLQFTRSRHERAARTAQEQTRDIMRTVKEGFFLLDADYRIGTVWSEALSTMFGRRDFAGVTFEDLLKDLVPPATLSTATKYIKLLWGDRAHENLMRSINPLSQLEVSVDTPAGGKDTRYLQFTFNRVTGDAGIRYVLASVTDVTANVLLARELQESQENANRQVDMLLGVVHVDPDQLLTFLNTAEAGLQMVNTILKQPARTDAEFRKKLEGLFRELHSLKGEATALGLMTVAERVHRLEDTVAELKQRPELSGNDFLPILLKLDELLAHLRSLNQLGTRLASLRAPGTPEMETHPEMESRPEMDTQRLTARDTALDAAVDKAVAQPPVDELGKTLQALAARLARDHGKNIRLEASGLAGVPGPYRNVVKDILIQLVRNSAVHGIEQSEVRKAGAKDATGMVRIAFARSGSGFELLVEDDGAGLSPEAIKAAAVEKRLISSAEAAAMDHRAAMMLIFKPGLSTQSQVSMDAGRGVGMDVVAKNVRTLGGKIGVTTNPGQFTRFRIALPDVSATGAAVA